MTGDLARKGKVRGGHRSVTRRGISGADETLDSVDPMSLTSPHMVKLTQQRDALKEKMKTLRLLDEEILDLVKDEEIEEEIEEADHFREVIQLAIGRVEAAL